MSKHDLAITFASESVDKAAGVIRGVSVITIGEALGHDAWVDAITLQQTKQCAETYTGGLKVKADHGSGVFSVTGFLRNFRLDGQQLRADLHLLESDENRAKLLEMAEKIPDTFGLSISFSGPDETRDGKRYLRCQEIYSADIVSEPAANPSGLLSQGVDAPVREMNPEEIKKCIADAVQSELSSFGTRLQKLESATSGQKPEEIVSEMGAIKATVAELSKKFELKTEETKQLAANLAGEFVKVLGLQHGPGASGAGTGNGGCGNNQPNDAEKFEAKYLEARKAGKSKTESIGLAVKAEPAGHQAFVQLKRSLKEPQTA